MTTVTIQSGDEIKVVVAPGVGPRGQTGAALGIATTSYDQDTGVLTVTYIDGTTFETSDLRGKDANAQATDLVLLSDEIIVNAGGASARQSVSDLGNQLLGGTAVGTEIAAAGQSLAELRASTTVLSGRIDTVELSQTTNNVISADWAMLAATTPSMVGQGAEIPDQATGTHTDPLSALTVSDAGRYRGYDTVAGAWTRIADTGLSSKADVAVAGTTGRVYDDGRFARSGLDLAVVDQGRRPIWSITDGQITVHLPLTAQLSEAMLANLNGGAAWITDGRWARCGYAAVIIGADRRIIIDLADQPASLADVTAAVEASAAQVRNERTAWIPWSDGADVYCDDASSGQSVQLSSGGGINTDPTLVGDVVIWTADRGDDLPYKPRARGGRYYSRPDLSDEHPVVPLPVMACWGDSTTAQGWPARLMDVGWGITALNFGRSSNTALGIASRCGALETSYDCPLIPGAGTEVVCTASGTSEGKPMQSWADASASINGWLVADSGAAPESGTYVTVRWDKDASAYYIKRYAVGADLAAGKYYFHAAPIPTGDSAWDDPPTSDMVWNHRDMMLALWIGRNSYTNPQLVFNMTQKIVAHHAPLSKRMILMPWLNGTAYGGGSGEGVGTAAYAYREQALALFQSEWPDNTLDLLPHFIAAADGSPEDQAAVAANYPPPSLMTDAVHPNAAGRLIVAQAVYDFCNAKGWV